MENRITVLVNSCDKYEDCWSPFFQCYKKYWNPNYPILLNTESKTFRVDCLNITTLQIYKCGDNPEWSERLIATLQQIDSKYILFMLDDFFLESKVDQTVVEQCAKWMDENKDVSVFYFLPMNPKGTINDHRFTGFSRLKTKCEYKLNCQAGLWRRDKLLSYLRKHESAWYFETLGSRRATRYHDLFYCRNYDAKPIMKYHYEVGGALHRGKWNREVVDQCNKEGISIDTSVRGFNDSVSGSTQSLKAYYLKRLNFFDMKRALIARWKSLKW